MPHRPPTETSSSDWFGGFVGIVVALTLLAIGYLVWSANDSAEERAAAVTSTVQP